MLIQHMKRHQKEVFKHHLEAKAEEKLAEEVKGDAQRFIKPFLITCPSFEQSLMTWMIPTYQPLHCCEEKSFREMCFSLNKKCPILSREISRSTGPESGQGPVPGPGLIPNDIFCWFGAKKNANLSKF